MRRHSKEGREPAKARRRKTATRKRPNSAKSSTAGEETKVTRLARELNEAREQQATTAEVLKLISRSTFDLKTVLKTLAESAARLCAADKGLIFQRDGDVLRLVANLGYSRKAERYWLEHPLAVDRGSATGRTVLEGRAIHIPDVLADPEYRATRYQEVAGYRSALSVPLLRNGTTIGTFSLSRDEVSPFSNKQIELVTTFADQAVIAIENTRLFEAEQQRTRELSESLEQQTATSEVLRIISISSGDLQPVFEAVLANATRLCDAAFGDIFRWEGGGLRLVASYNTPAAFAEVLKSDLQISPPVTKSPIHRADLTTDQRYLERNPTVVAAVELGGIRTNLVVPMLKENELIGTFVLNRQEVRPFTEKQVALATSFAS
jgi:GAF domain-containing protein